MRNCLRCNSPMVDDCDVKVEGGFYSFTVGKTSKLKDLFFGRAKPKLAICPKCGEISMYVEDTSIVNKK